jgi:hypothetical protein
MAFYLPMEGGATAALYDYSGNSIVATTNGDPVWLPTGGHDGHGAWEFDGSGDDLDGGENFPTNSSYTKTAWVYWTGSGANGGNNIISGDVNSGGHALWAADMFSNHLSAGHNGTWNSVEDDVALAQNTWVFVSLSYDDATDKMVLYKNGVSIDSATVSTPVTDATISIGSFGASNGWMIQGRIDDPRVWNRALTGEQIFSLYSNGQDVVKATETLEGEDWMACVTPFSASDVGTTVCSDTMTLETGTGIGDTPTPTQTALHQNHPNPFNPTTVISYDLVSNSRVSLKVYDVSGRLVKTLVDDNRPAGRQSATWDGTDNAGNHVSSGVYFYRLNTAGNVFTKKMVLLK